MVRMLPEQAIKKFERHCCRSVNPVKTVTILGWQTLAFTSENCEMRCSAFLTSRRGCRIEFPMQCKNYKCNIWREAKKLVLNAGQLQCRSAKNGRDRPFGQRLTIFDPGTSIIGRHQSEGNPCEWAVIVFPPSMVSELSYLVNHRCSKLGVSGVSLLFTTVSFRGSQTRLRILPIGKPHSFASHTTYADNSNEIDDII